MKTSHRHPSIGRHLWATTPLIISISLAVFLFHSAGWLDWAETLGLDFLTHLRRPLSSRHVLVVEVTAEDYATLFGSRSPLNSAVLADLIAKIAAFKPRVIGVDLDTSGPSGWEELRTKLSGQAPMVWGQSATPTLENGRTILQPSPVLGGSRPTPCSEEVGIGGMPVEADGRIRRYARTLPIAHRETNSLPWAVVRQFCLAVFQEEGIDPHLMKRCEELLDSEGTEASRSHQILPFANLPTRLSARAFLDENEPALAEKVRELVRDRIVLLGGNYLGQDLHSTADGPIPGVELMAEAVESEFQGRLVTPAEERLMILVEIIGGYILAGWHYFSHGRMRPWISRLIVPALALLLSTFLFWSLDYWANFIPVLVGVSIHELRGESKHRQPLDRKHRRKLIDA